MRIQFWWTCNLCGLVVPPGQYRDVLGEQREHLEQAHPHEALSTHQLRIPSGPFEEDF